MSDLLPGPLARGSAADADRCSAETSKFVQSLQDGGASYRRYRIDREVKRGGMGVILEVWDDELKRRLAMKVVRRDLASAPPSGDLAPIRALDRFIREARITGRLDHPGIVPVHEIGLTGDGDVYYTMRFVDGDDFGEILERIRAGDAEWTQGRALGVILKVCEAMDFAHSKGVIHRDLKPSNVMVGRFGEVYLMDWGLAREVGVRDRDESEVGGDGALDSSSSSSVTKNGETIGTPCFMSPEQARGEIDRVGPRSDIYSIGAMLYQLISGRLPFSDGAGQTAAAVIAQIQVEAPLPLSVLAPSARPELIAICEKAMSRAIEDRYASVQSLAANLRASIEGRVVDAYEAGALAEARKWILRNRALSASIAASIAFLMVLTAVGVWAVRTKVEREKSERAEASLRSLRRIEEFEKTCSDWDRARAEPGRTNEWWLATARGLLDGATISGPAERERTIGLERGPRQATARLDAKRAEILWCSRMLGLTPWPCASKTDGEFQRILAWAEDDGGRRWLEDLKRSATPPSEEDLRKPTLTIINRLAFSLVRPDEPRSIGSEVLALRLADHLVDLARRTGRWHPRYEDTRAFALFRLGRFAEGIEAEREAIRETPPTDSWRKSLEDNLAILEKEQADWRRIDEKRRMLEVLRLEADDLEQEVVDASRSHHGSYESWLSGEFDRLAAALRRLDGRARQIECAQRNPDFAGRWREAIAAIQVSPNYGSLVISPQIDLVPIGRDPESSLWEFSHLPSGEIATRDQDGFVILRPETGLIFVLLPGGTLPVPDDATGVAPQAEPIEPFFLSKYEMTRQQWARLAGEWPYEFENQYDAYPQSSVNWDDCDRLFRRVGGWLRLPSQEQWEFGCRARTTSRWCTGDDPMKLGAVANLRGRKGGGLAIPVGSLGPNAFGLHDVHGNVAELCWDPVEGDEPVPIADCGRTTESPRFVVRGGSYDSEPGKATSAASSESLASRRLFGRHGRRDQVGLRPARLLTQ